MTMRVSRRGFFGEFLAMTPALALAPQDERATDNAVAVGPSFPTQEPELAREMVGVSHGNVKRVRELLEARPTLARASWDWGFGDWESALGAASHVGNREIAELLISKGARPSIFSAAVLGQVEVVKAFVAASPGVQGTRGPHGITLLAHARAGGAPARQVVAFLESVGGADPKPTRAPLSESESAALTGEYSFGPAEGDRISITFDRGSLWFTGRKGTARGLSHVGYYAFFPAGAEAVRIRFSLQNGRASSLTIHDPGLVLTARRT